MAKEVVFSSDAPAAIGPYVQATKSGNTLYVSGQLGIDMSTGKLPETVEEQATCSMKNLGAILAEAGATPADVLKTTVFITDMADFKAVNEVYGAFFGDSFPARSCIQVAGLPLGAKVEVECIATLA